MPRGSNRAVRRVAGVLLAGISGCATQPARSAPPSLLPPPVAWLAPPQPYPAGMLAPPPAPAPPPPLCTVPVLPPLQLCFAQAAPSGARVADELAVRLDACRVLARRAAPRAVGRILVRLGVDASGSVTSVEIDSTADPLSERVLGCVTSAALGRSPFAMVVVGELPKGARATAELELRLRDDPASPASPRVDLRCWGELR